MPIVPRISLFFAGDCDAAFTLYQQCLGGSGRVDVPLQETFWARRFGMVTDRFGIPWAINCEERKLD